MKPRIPSLVRIVQIDYWATLGALFPVAFWAFFLGSNVLGDPLTGFAPIAGAVTIAGLIAILWRWRTIVTAFDHGVELPAIVSSVSPLCTV